ncbi:MAG: rhomboid family intramembrane serine protease [Hyphomicrobiales bacterium]
MFFPITDRNPLKIISFQYVTATIIAINVIIYVVMEFAYSERAELAANYAYGVIPAVLFDERNLPEHLARIPSSLSLITYQFFHGDWLHLLGNMMFLWVFGDNVEDSLGHWRFLVFYLLSGAAAGAVFALTETSSTVPLIGASGAMAGILGAYLILHPKKQVWVLLFMRIPVPLPAVWAILGWIGFQFVSLFSDSGEGPVSVAWWAHIGGFFAGIVLLFVLAPKTLRKFTE